VPFVRATRTGLVAGLAALALAACSGGGPAPTSSPTPAGSLPSGSPSTSPSTSPSGPPVPGGEPAPSAAGTLTALPVDAVAVPAGYSLRWLPGGVGALRARIADADQLMSAALNAALLHEGAVAGTVQVFRLTPRAAALGDELLTELLDAYTQGATLTPTAVAGQRVWTAKDIRDSGLDLAAWRRGSDVVLVTAKPGQGDLRAVTRAILAGRR
jgi:hypothetical protein